MDQITSQAKGLGKRSGLAGKLPIKKPDALAAVTVGIANVPDGMASAALAGVNPVYGIYTLMVGTPIAALSCSTQLMMFNTTSAMTLVATDALGTRTGDERVQALIVVALVAGIFQLGMGLLGLGMIIKFVSNAVMVGFLTGIATLIIMGQLWDLTGFVGEGGSKLQQTAQLLANLRDVDIATTALGIGSIAIMVLLGRTKLATFNLLIALGVAAGVQWIFDFPSVSLVGIIPRELPSIQIPQISLVPAMLLAGVATGVVGLLQAAGVAQAFPNPDGSETSNSRDFMGQGIANIAASFFRGMAGGGSLSGTALNVSAGARSRYAAAMQAIVVVIVVLVFSGVLSLIPNAALAALLIYAAALSIKFDAIAAVRRTSWMSFAAMGLTFFATLVVPLQQAVIFGVVIASILFIYRSSTDIRIQQIKVEGSQLIVSDPPQALPDNAVTVLDVEGNLFYAGARTLSERLPDATTATSPVVVMRLRGQSEVGSTFFKVIGKYADQIRDHSGRLILTGVQPNVRERMLRTGNLELIGEENVLMAGHVLGGSTLAGYDLGADWLLGVTPTIDSLLPSSPVVSEEAPAETPSEVVSASPELASPDSASAWVHMRMVAERYLPWRQGGGWQSAAALGIILFVIGIVGVLSPGFLDGFFRGLIGVILVAIAIFWIYQTFVDRGARRSVASNLRMFSAGVAIMAGGGMLFVEFGSVMSTDSARLLLGFGLILIGAAGLGATWFLPEGTPDRLGAIGINILVIAIGAIELFEVRKNQSFLDRSMWLMIAMGGALFVYAIVKLRHSGSTDADAPGEPTS